MSKDKIKKDKKSKKDKKDVKSKNGTYKKTGGADKKHDEVRGRESSGRTEEMLSTFTESSNVTVICVS